MANLSTPWGNNFVRSRSAAGPAARGGGQRSAPPNEPGGEAEPKDEGDVDGELDLGEPVIDESLLPELDTEDAEALRDRQSYDDLLDHRWLERAAEEELEDEPVSVEDAGVTIDLDEEGREDDAQVVDLDVGGLLTELPDENTDLDTDERSENGFAFSVSIELLSPGGDTDADDREVGDDELFPVFDDLTELDRRGPATHDDVGDDDPRAERAPDEGPSEHAGDD